MFMPMPSLLNKWSAADIDAFSYYVRESIINLGQSLQVKESAAKRTLEISRLNPNERSKCIREEAAYTSFSFTNEIDLKKSWFYFIHNIGKIKTIRFCFETQQIQMLYMHLTTPSNTKEARQHKRLIPVFSIKDIEQTLFHLDGGYVKHESDGITYVNRRNFTIQGFGCDFDKNNANTKAALEYLERHAASISLPHTIVGSYEQLKDTYNLIDPTKLGLYEAHLAEKFQVTPYTRELETEWCQARSARTDNIYYVPLQHAQYLKDSLLNRFVFENSNGSALGNSYEEASLYSILEAYERDVFFNQWFGDEQLQEIHYSEQRTDLMGRVLYFKQLGYRLQFFSLNNSRNIPVVWCLLTSMDEQNTVYSITGLGCHLNIHHAMDAAFFEVLNVFRSLRRMDKEKLRQDIRDMEQRQELTDIKDHILYFASYQSRLLLEQRISSAKAVELEQLARLNYSALDIEQELHWLLEKMDGLYEDVIIIDQTNEYLSAFSLYCTKAILIGALPVDFTTRLIRFTSHTLTNKKIEGLNIHPLG